MQWVLPRNEVPKNFAAERQALLFEAIAADIEAGKREQRPAYVAPITVPMMYYLASSGPAGAVHASGVIADLLRLLEVVPLNNQGYHDALFVSKLESTFEYEDAIQFATCRRVNAKYLVTRNNFGHVKRAPVDRRTAAEMLPFFRR
jgi:predicted nucleic acid-binding protein